MRAIDVMTAPVISISSSTSLSDVVPILLKRRISGVPVVDDGEVVGMVGVGDLLHRCAIGTDAWLAHRTWWRHLLESGPVSVACT